MSKCRIFKKDDGRAYYDRPTSKYQNNIEACRIPENLIGLPYIIIEEQDAHPDNSVDGNYVEMIYFDGECKKENLKQDKEWKACLMPLFLIKQKHLARLNQIIDEAIADPDDTRIALRTLREREKCTSWDEKQWYEQALVNLDARVSGGEEDKPVIRQKLQAKVNELSR